MASVPHVTDTAHPDRTEREARARWIVLVVDDEPDVEALFRQQFRRDLRAGRFDMEFAGDAATALQRIRLERRLAFLGTLGNNAPFIGLFGTVVGIMQAFEKLGQAGANASAGVMPGISEALVATAMGLFAAIPAVIAYNRYSAQVDNLVANYETFSEEFSSILHRQAHAGRKSG